MMNPTQYWSAFLGPEHGPAFASAMTMFCMVEAKDFDAAIARINHEEAIGPMLNPTAYQGGERFKNARKMKEILGHFAAARRLIAELPE